MANVCYVAIVTKSRVDFNNLLDTVYDKNGKFFNYCEEHCIDYMGSLDYWGDFIIRFECRWEPDFAIARYLSKVATDEITMWTQTEWAAAPASKTVYINGKRLSKTDIPYDITNTDMQKCIICTDWNGIDWYLDNENGSIWFKGTVGSPFVKAYFVKYDEDGNKTITGGELLFTGEIKDYLAKIGESVA